MKTVQATYPPPPHNTLPIVKLVISINIAKKLLHPRFVGVCSRPGGGRCDVFIIGIEFKVELRVRRCSGCGSGGRTIEFDPSSFELVRGCQHVRSLNAKETYNAFGLLACGKLELGTPMLLEILGLEAGVKN
jgi:hypothetical protein